MLIITFFLAGSSFGLYNGNSVIRVPGNYPTIQEALDAAGDGDTVLLCPGIFRGILNRNLDFHGKSIELTSEYGADYTIIDCEFDGRGIFFQSGESESATVSGITIKNGDTAGYRYDDYGGAIYTKNNSAPTISHCTFTGNSSEYGGGVSCRCSSPSLSSNSVTLNSANFGGGLHCANGNIFIGECIVAKNSAIVGGGIDCIGIDTQICLVNCIISENISENCGGGLSSYSDSSIEIIHGVIWNNISTNGGGGIHIVNGYADIVNSILWHNVPVQIYQLFSIINVEYSNIEEGWEGLGNLDGEPCFISPENGDFHLDVNSPCINTAVYAGIDTDIDGDLRPIGGGYDMGVDEAFLEGPVIFIFPTHLVLEGVVGKTLDNQILTIMAVGTEQIEFSVESGEKPWIKLIGELNGELNPGDSAFVTIEFDISNLTVGQHLDTLTVFSNDPYRSEILAVIQIDLFSNGLIRIPADFENIQNAINYALDSAVIKINDGTYSGEGNRNINFWGKEIIVESVNGYRQTIVDCENLGRGFLFHNSEDRKSILRGLTILNGNSDYQYTRSGGGVCCFEGSPTIDECFITNCNTSYDGGAIYCLVSNPEISNCIIKGNNAEGDGGGIHYYLFDSGVLFNCLFSGNYAKGYGGAVYYHRSTAPISNCTFYSNHASRFGGAIECYESTNTISNCIFWNDEPDEINFNCTITEILFSDIDGGWPGEGNIDLNPLFINPASLDFNLLPESPCIDSGDPTFDVPRGGGSRIDMGAYEYWQGWNILNKREID